MAEEAQLNRYFVNSDHSGCPLHVMEWLPDHPAKGIVQISHGMAEHIERYGEFARALTTDGYIVIGHDHTGHGRSTASDRFGHMSATDGWQEAAADLQQIASHVQERHPGLPLGLFGHSMGSFLARTGLIQAPNQWQACILSGTAWNSSISLTAGKLLIKLELLLRGERAYSTLLDKIVFGPYNESFKPNRTRHDWLSVDKNNVDAYISDPFCGFVPSVGFFNSLISIGFPYIQRQAHLGKMNVNLPVHFIAGAEDPVGGFGKGVRRTYQAFADAGMKQISIELYSDTRHEAIFDLKKEEIVGDLLDWLNSHLSCKGST